MSRKSEFTATIAKPGYKNVEIKVTTKIAGGGGAAMAGNVLVGGLIGAGVDVATGAMNDLTPNPVHLDLEKDEGVVSAPAPMPTQTIAPATAATPATPAGAS